MLLSEAPHSIAAAGTRRYAVSYLQDRADIVDPRKLLSKKQATKGPSCSSPTMEMELRGKAMSTSFSVRLLSKDRGIQCLLLYSHRTHILRF